MNPTMLHFLRCKSQEASFTAPLSLRCGFSGRRTIHRVSIDRYQNQQVDFASLRHARSLHVFEYTPTASLLEAICEPVGLNLKLLSIRGSLINLLPAQVKALRHLKTLDLSDTGALALPEEIGELQRLETLDLSNTMLTELPVGIGRLQRLRTLDARNTCVKGLPREIIRELSRLETLDVSFTMLAELPGEVAELRRLKRLCARGTCVREFLREAGELRRHLETLDLSGTLVAEIPSGVGQLQQLKTLGLSGTMVETLPEEIIRNLQNLETLDVSRTKVAELPKEIWELKCLKTLNISSTRVVRDLRVRELPWESGQRSSLLHVLVDDDGGGGSPKAVKVLGAECRAWRNNNNGDASNSLLSDFRERLSITLFDGLGSSWKPLELARFKVAGGAHVSIPPWVRALKDISSLEIRLRKLEEEDLKFLRDMPNLQVLALALELRQGNNKPIAVTGGGGFPKLESFCVDSRVPRVRFYKGAMPRLRLLEFKFYAGRGGATHGGMGLANLRSLQRVCLQKRLPEIQERRAWYRRHY